MLSLELVYMTPIPPQLELLLLHSMSTGQLSLTDRASLVTAVNEELEIAAGAATVEGASDGAFAGGWFEVKAGETGLAAPSLQAPVVAGG